jgi:hypothetical protein
MLKQRYFRTRNRQNYNIVNITGNRTMNLKTYMILCVTCALNWAIFAFQTMDFFLRKIPRSLNDISKNGKLSTSLSGMLTTIIKTQSTWQLNMMTVRYFLRISNFSLTNIHFYYYLGYRD